MSSWFAVVLLVMSTSGGLRAASYDLKISQEHTRVSKEPNLVAVKCTADVEFSGCQFRWWDRDGTAGPPLDFALGAASPVDWNHLSDSLSGYAYQGAGLDQGWKSWMVSCRVSVKGGGWSYAWMDIYAEIWTHLPNTLGQRVAVVLPGQDARLTMNAGRPLSCCRFHLPAVSYRVDFDEGTESSGSSGRHRYYGAGLHRGECGLILSNVTEADNGPSRGYVRSTLPSTDDQRFNPMIVARRPSAPVLSVNSHGSNVTATCEVQQSRPIAEITWLLGNDVIRRDSLDDTPSSATDEWRWPWMGGSIMQRVRFILTSKDEGKVLTCRVAHVTLESPLEATQAIIGEHVGAESVYLRTHHSSTPASSLLSFFCQPFRVPSSEPGNWVCPKDEVYELRLREAGALARAAEVAEGASKSRARAEAARALAAELMVEAARAHVKAEDARVKNSEEELQFERERRMLSQQMELSQGVPCMNHV